MYRNKLIGCNQHMIMLWQCSAFKKCFFKIFWDFCFLRFYSLRRNCANFSPLYSLKTTPHTPSCSSQIHELHFNSLLLYAYFAYILHIHTHISTNINKTGPGFFYNGICMYMVFGWPFGWQIDWWLFPGKDYFLDSQYSFVACSSLCRVAS